MKPEEKIKIQELKDKHISVEGVIELINKNSTDLPPNQKRCIICNGIANSLRGALGMCKCKFLYFDYDYDIGKHSRILLKY